MKNYLLKSELAALIFFTLILPLMAQLDEPPIEDDPNPAPIDNWMVLLIFIAFSVGAYFIWKARQKQTA